MACRFLHKGLPLLALMLGVAACYEPVNLAPEGDPNIPSVYCVLNPTDTQYLELRYLSRVGAGSWREIDDAEVLFSEFSVREDGQELPVRSAAFHPLGKGMWRLVLPPNHGSGSNIRPGHLCRLQVNLPSGDTLSASTRMPVADAVEAVTASTNSAETDTLWFQLDPQVPGRLLVGPSGSGRKPAFRLNPFKGTVWVSKVGWSPDRQAWLLEEELATNRDDLADGFNVTGLRFVRSDDPKALETYPEVEGQPLHDRYIRFVSGAQADTLFFSGDFKGPHYGNVDRKGFLGLAISADKWYQGYCEASGIPYKLNILSTGIVGKLEFMAASEEYDHYLKDVMTYRLVHENSTDVAGIYDNTNIYSNIEGGTGVFGAAIVTRQDWTCGSWVWE